MPSESYQGAQVNVALKWASGFISFSWAEYRTDPHVVVKVMYDRGNIKQVNIFLVAWTCIFPDGFTQIIKEHQIVPVAEYTGTFSQSAGNSEDLDHVQVMLSNYPHLTRFPTSSWRFAITTTRFSVD
jgi:hypothetical protein